MPQSFLSPPFRAEHVGSLPRPTHLMARERLQKGEIARTDLARIESDCIREAVSMQERVGIGAITDGAYSKRGWREFLYDRCAGFGPETVERAFPIRMFDGSTVTIMREPKLMRRLGRREPLSAADFSVLKAITPKPIKANLPTPSVAHFFTGDPVLNHAVYPTAKALMDDLARIMRGKSRLHLPANGRGTARGNLRSQQYGGGTETWRRSRPTHRTLISNAINDSIRDRPANMTVIEDSSGSESSICARLKFVHFTEVVPLKINASCRLGNQGTASTMVKIVSIR